MAKRPTPAARPKTTNQTKQTAPRTVASVFKPLLSDTFGEFRRFHLVPALMIVALATALYIRSVSYEYVLDDQIVVHDNAYTKQGIAGWGKLLTTETFEGYFGASKGTKKLVEGGRYRPLSLMTFAVEWQFFAPDTTTLPVKYDKMHDYTDAKTLPVRFVHHLMNILFYCLSGLLLYRVLWLLFPLSLREKWFLSVPFVATLLWIAHPTHVEAVANIKGRDEVLSLIGALGSLYFVLRWLSDSKNWRLIFAASSYFLGLLAKENTITFLAVVPFTMYFFSQARRSQYVTVFVPFALATVLYMMMRISAVGFLTVGQQITDVMNNPFADMTFGQKYATIFYTLLDYLRLSFYPHPLTHDYYPYHIPLTNWTDMRALTALAVYVGLGAVVVWGWKAKRVESYAILFFLATISIVSNIVFPVGTFMNERFIYFSTIGVCLWLGWVLMRQLPTHFPALRAVGWGVAALILAGFCYKTWTRVPVWATTESLNRSAIAVSKNSARANVFMATALFEAEYLPKIKTTDSLYAMRVLDTAEQHITHALEIHPSYTSALTMKAGFAAEHHKRDHDTQKLLKAYLEICQQGKYVEFMTTYTRWMHGRFETNLLENYYRQAYQVFTQKQRPDYAKTILGLAKQLNPNIVL